MDRVQAGHGTRHRQRPCRQGIHRRRREAERRGRSHAHADSSRNGVGQAGARAGRRTAANALDLALAVAAINQASGAVGSTIRPAESHSAFDGAARLGEIVAALEQMRSGAVPIAFVRGANPAYSLPSSAKFAEAFAKVPFKVSFSLYPDETTSSATSFSQTGHSLESWGDAEAGHSTISFQQPAMDRYTRPPAPRLTS